MSEQGKSQTTEPISDSTLAPPFDWNSYLKETAALPNTSAQAAYALRGAARRISVLERRLEEQDGQ